MPPVESAAAEARRLRRGIASLQRSVSPPAKRRAISPTTTETHEPAMAVSTPISSTGEGQPAKTAHMVPSPFQLTRIRDLPASANVDTVGIEQVLRDPLIMETWVFNYMFDVDWLMNCLDPDTRHLTQVKVVHGNWKREDPQRMRMEAWAQQYPNLEVITAYMPEPFGTHHSKMLVHFRADDTAQVIIHTANMIPQDWTNMTQAVWRSPLLPLLPASTSASPRPASGQKRHPIGSGARFGSDLHAYLSAYGARLRPLATKLARHDFSSVRAALVASVPGRLKLNECDPATKTAWGWVGLKEVLASRRPTSSTSSQGKQGGMVVAQVSSIASLGAAEKWLQHFHSVLSTPAAAAAAAPSPSSSSLPSQTTLSNAFQKPDTNNNPSLRIVFPTPAEIRSSLDGYASGASIHTKTQANAAQRKQAASLRPFLCRWDGGGGGSAATTLDAMRGTAAPHVKTYIRFSQSVDDASSAAGGGASGSTVGDVTVDWALLSSANLSTQAWGALAVDEPGTSGEGKKKKKKRKKSKRDDDDGDDGVGDDDNSANNSNKAVRICSWEVGVCVWPALFSINTDDINDGSNHPPAAATAIMTPVFGTDTPSAATVAAAVEQQKPVAPKAVVVGLRLPYSLPLARYVENVDDMWCASARYAEPDRWGRVWGE